MRIFQMMLVWLVGWLLLLEGCTVSNSGIGPIPSPRPDNGCFDPIGIIPGKTGKGEVLDLLGPPDKVDSWFGEERWLYVQDSDRFLSISFSAELVDSLSQYGVSNCTLGDIIGTLGPPEIIELIAQNNQPGPPVYPSKQFHYPGRGMVFVSPCPGALEWRACSSFRPTDEITRRGFYRPTTVEELVRAAQGDPCITFLRWNGFVR